MQYQIKDEQGEWINGNPTQNGQHYRFIDPAGGVVESYWFDNSDNRPAHTISNQVITADGQPLQLFAGNYNCQPRNIVQLQGNVTDSEGNTVTSINIPVTLKVPLVRHANGVPTTTEIYLNATIQNGVITATGEIESSGDWKVLMWRVNVALKRVSNELQALGIEPFKFDAADITFIA